MSGIEEVKQAVDSAVDAVVARLRGELVETIVQRMPQPAAAGAPAEGAGLDAFRDQLYEMLQGGGQVELLNNLLVAVGGYWSRAIIYLVKGEDFQPWAAQGFEGGVGNAAAKASVIKASADTILAGALSGAGAGAEDSLLTSALGAPEGTMAAVPLGIRGKAAAVLYADGPKAEVSVAVAALELFARLAAAAIELNMHTKRSDPGVRTRARTVAAPGAAAPPAADVPVVAAPVEAAPVAEPAPEMPAEPEMAAALPTPPPTDFSVPAPAPAAPEPPAAPAPAPPEPPAAAAPPPGPTPPAQQASAAPEVSGGMVVDAGQEAPAPAKKFSRWKPVREQLKEGDVVDPSLADIPEPERQKHVAAKKKARLLVNDVKLYNEAKVAVGRKNKDLYERLKDDIEKARQNYLESVDPDVVAKTDYFRDELVAVLAEGDASALGMG